VEGEKKACESEFAICLACVNIIKSTSTMRCRRQSVFEIERTNRLSLGRTNHNPPSVLLRPIKRFWTSQVERKRRRRVFQEFFVRPINPSRNSFSRVNFFLFFFCVSRDTSHIWASGALALLLDFSPSKHLCAVRMQEKKTTPGYRMRACGRANSRSVVKTGR